MGMKRKQLIGSILTLMLLSSLVFGIIGCTQTTPQPAETPSTTPSTTPTGQVRELKCAVFAPKGTAAAGPVLQMFKDIETYTNGTIKVKVYYAGELAETKDIPELTRKGVLDISITAPTYYPALFPINAATQQMHITSSRSDMTAYIQANLLKEFPEMQQEYAAQNQYCLGRASNGVFYLLSKKPVRGYADLKGMKIRPGGGVYPGKLVEAAGGVAVFLPVADWYEGLMRGTVDGVSGESSALESLKLYESAKYLGWPIGSCMGWHVAFNLDVWKSLTKDQQQACLRAKTDWINRDVEFQLSYENTAIKKMQEAGVEYIPFPEKDWEPILANFGDPYTNIGNYMKNELKVDAGFTDRFVNRWHQLSDEYDTQYIKTGKVWKYTGD